MENDATFSNFNNDEDTINNNYKTDVFHMWTDKSQDISFKSTTNCIGNGEEKLARELDILKPLGGQNSTIDLIHPHIGNISVKDMTNDDCRLGTECRYHMNIIFAQIVNPFLTWILKYNSKCEFAEKMYESINTKYGSSRTTILDGIHKRELSKSNLEKLNLLLNNLRESKLNLNIQSVSLSSEYVDDIITNLNNKTLQELLDNCVQKEAIDMTLIIVDEKKGWIIINNTLNKITCPRITSGSPRINYN
tara:strand:- start:1183 stop:1929 length:747 start_codon:yes stop_codon:yes gene_type:complete